MSGVGGGSAEQFVCEYFVEIPRKWSADECRTLPAPTERDAGPSLRRDSGLQASVAIECRLTCTVSTRLQAREFDTDGISAGHSN